MTANPALPVLHFGPYTLDPAAVQLRCQGQVVTLRPKAYAVLLALLRRPGEMVSKEDLLDGVWGRRFITEGVIKSVVAELRTALGDDARQARWIATVPGLGYRFIGPVQAAASDRAVTASPPRGNLPATPPALIGREGELQVLADWLPARRLVTITGSSGMGKTRLALAAAQAQAADSARWPDGVWVMELAPLAAVSTAAADLCATWAQGLQLDAQAGSNAATLGRALAPMRLLLVLDNAEHLLAALAPLLAQLLAQAPGLHLLVTSQEPLRMPEEQLLRLAPLALPNWPLQAGMAEALATADADPNALLISSPAVRLFLDRVALRLPDFSLAADQVQAVADICRALDGVPLALELAAARVPLLGVQGVAERLLGEADARLQLLSHGARNAVPRQRSLRDAVAWSHALLDARQREVWRRLAVFRGGFTLEGAQAVCGGRADGSDSANSAADSTGGQAAWHLLETLEALVEKSLLSVSMSGSASGGAPRFTWLESLRAYALERLHEAGETASTTQAHLHFMVAYWQRADARAISDPILLWLARHLPELANLRSALRGAVADPGRADAGLALVVHSAMLWQRAGLALEGRAWCDAFQAQAQTTADSPLRAGHDLAMAVLATYGNVYPKAACMAAALRAADAFEQQGDGVRAYFALHLAFQLSLRTQPALDSDALLARMAGLEQPGWSELLTRYRRHARGYADRMAGHTSAYLRFCRDEVARCQRLNAVAEGWAAAQGLMLAEHDAGQPAAALQVGRQALAEIRATGRLHQHAALLALWTTMLAHSGDGPATRPALAEALPVLRSTGTPWMAHGALAWLAASEGRNADAARLLGWCVATEQARNEGRSAGGYIARATTELAAQLALRLGAAALAEHRAAGATLGAAEAEALALRHTATTG